MHTQPFCTVAEETSKQKHVLEVVQKSWVKDQVRRGSVKRMQRAMPELQRPPRPQAIWIFPQDHPSEFRIPGSWFVIM